MPRDRYEDEHETKKRGNREQRVCGIDHCDRGYRATRRIVRGAERGLESVSSDAILLYPSVASVCPYSQGNTDGRIPILVNKGSMQDAGRSSVDIYLAMEARSSPVCLIPSLRYGTTHRLVQQ